MENQKNLVEQNVASKTRLFMHEASQNNRDVVREGKEIQNQSIGNKQLFVGAFPKWDLLPQTGFVRRIKKSNI